MFSMCVPMWVLIACFVGFGGGAFLLYTIMNRERSFILAEHNRERSFVLSENKRLQDREQDRERELREKSREQETRKENREGEIRKESYDIGYKTGWADGLSSIQVLTKNTFRVLDDGWFKKVTERGNLFVVMAGGQFKAGYLGQEELTEDQLRKLLESMQIVSGLIGCHSGSAMAEGLKKIFDGRPKN